MEDIVQKMALNTEGNTSEGAAESPRGALCGIASNCLIPDYSQNLCTKPECSRFEHYQCASIGCLCAGDACYDH
jgi:hypothetical protein